MTKKILIVEDRANVRNLFLECLRAEGFYAIDAENGAIGIQQAREHLPDLILCDIGMPKLDGYGVLAMLRHNPVTAIIPFIYVTGRGSQDDIRKGMELGADDYLTKPCSMDKLLRAVAARLERQKALRQWYAFECHRLPEAFLPDAIKALESQLTLASISLLNQVFQFIESHYYQPITLRDVAQAVGYSPAYLTDWVKQQTGQTVQQWIIKRRMGAACSLLIETEQTINQIAEAVGYNDKNFFYQFRQHYGMTPKMWRTKHGVLSTAEDELKNS